MANSMNEAVETYEVQVKLRKQLTESISEFTLTPSGVQTLNPFQAGAHITIHTPSGASRRYSLLGDGTAPTAYRVAIKLEPKSRGGSRSMHDLAVVGSTLMVEPPENDFALKDAPEYLLIAGGIGITPIKTMAEDLHRAGKNFRMIYCTRSVEETAFYDEIKASFGGRVTFHHDGGDPDRVYDFWEHFETIGKGHVYCCGPAPLMDEIRAISGHWPEGRVNFEDFKPVEVVRADDTAFAVTLAKSGRVIEVPSDRSLLEALRDAGVETVSSCESGTCGTCKCGLIEGEADHRDMVLMNHERPDHIMLCVSRAKSNGLVLDL